MATTPDIRELAAGLQFPEGPIAMPDGSTLVVEIRRGTLSRVTPTGEIEVVAELGGGPNGAAIGPDGAAYVVNNGGFLWTRLGDMHIPLDLATHSNEPPDFEGGWVDRVDLTTGEVTTLYRECDGYRLRGPNDIVFDTDGGFWFTDLGKQREHDADRGGLFYARPDGSKIVTAAFPLTGPNGVGLSPDGSRVYAAETLTGRLLAWDLDGPGTITGRPTCIAATKGPFDSLAVEADGHVVIAAITHGLCVVAPDGSEVEYLEMPDPLVTNVCFTGDDLRTALVTLSGAGRLVALDWPRPGAPLSF